MDDVFASLTPSQCEAVRHVDGPLLMLAGPGSGKTRVVTHRIAHMLQQGVPARQILALTFTNKAADEMRMRVERMMPRQPVWIGTFHRFCSRLLRRYASLVGLQENFSIYDTQDSRRALKQAIQDIQLELQRTTPDQIAQEFDLTLAQVHAALAYYFEHIDAIRAEIRRERDEFVRLKAENPSKLRSA